MGVRVPPPAPILLYGSRPMRLGAGDPLKPSGRDADALGGTAQCFDESGGLRGGIAELGHKLGPIVWQFAPTKRFDAGDFFDGNNFQTPEAI